MDSIRLDAARGRDAEVFSRLLAEEKDIETSLTDLEHAHVMDITGPALIAIDRARSTAAQLAIELRIAYRYLGGVP
ncbi:MAG: hypothetical protein WBA97_34335 [Actinophytocola sp.]|uniref:hypothetical protein n=1 Tax=Actinophytocola sp. TaxID=1872138 RepID=UPI003C75C3FF